MSAGTIEQALTDTEVAPLVGVSTSTLRHWRSRGEGPPYYRVGPKAIRYRWSEVEEWMDDNRRLSA